MHVIYKVTYLPHLETNFPKFYIGSKYEYRGNYYGSVSSVQVFDFSNGIPLAEWWKAELNRNPENFIFEIIESFESITPIELVSREREIQIVNDVKNSNDFFNMSIATEGFCSVERTENSKKLISEKTKQYWDSPEGLEKKKRMAERNRIIKSDELKKKWQDPEYRKYMAEKKSSRIIKDSTREKLSNNILSKNPIEYKGKIYYGWKSLSDETGVTKRLYERFYMNGYDPEPNINVRNIHKQVWNALAV